MPASIRRRERAARVAWSCSKGVVLPAMLQVTEVTGDTTFQDYTFEHFDFIFTHLPYFRKQAAQFGPQNPSYGRLIEMQKLGQGDVHLRDRPRRQSRVAADLVCAGRAERMARARGPHPSRRPDRGICVGTASAHDAVYSYNRPTELKAMQGYGPTLMAGAEVITMLRSCDIRRANNTFSYDRK